MESIGGGIGSSVLCDVCRVEDLPSIHIQGVGVSLDAGRRVLRGWWELFALRVTSCLSSHARPHPHGPHTQASHTYTHTHSHLLQATPYAYHYHAHVGQSHPRHIHALRPHRQATPTLTATGVMIYPFYILSCRLT